MTITAISRPVRCASDGAPDAKSARDREGGAAAMKAGSNPNMRSPEKRDRFAGQAPPDVRTQVNGFTQRVVKENGPLNSATPCPSLAASPEAGSEEMCASRESVYRRKSTISPDLCKYAPADEDAFHVTPRPRESRT